MKSILFTAVFTTAMLMAQAQSYELRIVEKGQYANVQLRNIQSAALRSADTKVTDVVFGIKWHDTGIEGLQMVPGDYKMVHSAGVRQHNGYSFQAFGAMQTPYTLPTDWQSGKWVDIAVVKIVGEPQRGPYQARLALAEYGFHITTDPNIGVNLKDETPVIVGYAAHDVAAAPHTTAPARAEIDLRVVKYGPKHGHLTWMVETPEEIEAFDIERKTGEDTWTQIARIVSEGQYVHVYIDEDVYDGIRLKQTITYRIRAFSGLSERISEEKILDFSAQKMFIEVYPNPAADKVQVDMTPTETNGDAFLEIYATDGRLVYRNALLPGSVKEMIDLAGANVESGSYTVHLVSAGKILDVRSLHVMR